VASGSKALERAESGIAREGRAVAAPDSAASRGPEGAAREFLRFVDVRKSYDQKQLIVKGFNLDVAKGEFITLLGPSGSGKTTVLMLLAGFEAVTGGDIRIDGASVTRMPPYKRNIGMVFQSYALFPHMTVNENLAYPLTVRGVPRTEIAKRVGEYLDLVELGGFGDRPPGRLSGGQRQRVALARALIFEPSLVLMDEPLGALDRKLREQMQFEITRLHKKLGFTVIYVTHDQTEALTMSDRVAVFNAGVVQQCAPPNVLYEHPENAFVAGFIGENNLIPGKVVGAEGDAMRVALAGGNEVVARRADATLAGGACVVAVRPEKTHVASGEHPHDNRINAKFTMRHYVGDFIRYYFELPDASGITVKMLNHAAAPRFADGEMVRLGWHARDCHAFRTN
jgi:putative spermidine/putrescine transport system ATP-binding protein